MKNRFAWCGIFSVTCLVSMGTSSCPTTTTPGGTGTGGSTGAGTGTGTGTGSGTGTVSGTTMTSVELQLATDALAAMNSHRAGKGLAPLTFHAASAQVAYLHCQAMEARNFFAHIDPQTGTDPATRAKNAGITHDPQGSLDPTSGNPFVGENLFMATNSNPTGQFAVDSWVGSPGHHTQIDAPLTVLGAQTMPAWTHCGIGVRKTGNQSWWTAMFLRNPN